MPHRGKSYKPGDPGFDELAKTVSRPSTPEEIKLKMQNKKVFISADRDPSCRKHKRKETMDKL